MGLADYYRKHGFAGAEEPAGSTHEWNGSRPISLARDETRSRGMHMSQDTMAVAVPHLKMQKILIKFLITIAQFFYVSNAVSLCCLRPSVYNDHDSPIDSLKRCDGDAACQQGISQYDKARTDLIGWNWDKMERESRRMYPGECAFTRFNRKIGGERNRLGSLYETLYVQELIKQASLEERNNHDQVIVYHGESMGVWLLQVLAKQLKYPHAKEWLPLRFGQNLVDVNQGALQKMFQNNLDMEDNAPEFTTVGLAAHVNLMSKNPWESAAYAFLKWSGCSGMSLWQPIGYVLTSLGIPTKLHAQIEECLNIMKWAIGWKMKWSYSGYIHGISTENYQFFFPSLNANDNRMIQAWRESYLKIPEQNGVGVILQIVMPSKLAKKYSYASGPYGKNKNEPFLEYYREHKNRLDDDGQLRIAMGHPFTRYPSPVKIKALSPIFKEQDLMHLIHKMMKDTVDFIKKNK